MTRVLPGIAFQTVPPELGEKLPRMDVAAFVGFAAAGPIGVPVVVEDEVHFGRIFGADLALAWDEAAGMVHRSYLGPAVRAFFRGGGRRCWVVRVASAEAVANRFLVPGLMRLDPNGYCRPAPLRARAEGSWSDGLRTGAALVADSLTVMRFHREGDGLGIELSRLSRLSLRPGDLLRFTFPAAVLYLAVATVETVGQVWKVGGQEFWFRREPTAEAASSGLDVWLRQPEGRRRRLKQARWSAPAAPGGEHRVFVPGSAPPGPGALLEVETDNYPTLYLSVVESRAATEGEISQLGLGAGPWTVLTGQDPLGPASRRVGRALAWGVPETSILCEKLTFELLVAEGDAQPTRLGGLGFCPGHARYVGDLPTDARLFARDEHVARPRPDGPVQGEQFRAQAADPRFPLAAEGEGSEVYLPLGMTWQVRRESFAAPLPAAGTPGQRNGLGAFDPAIFLDPDLDGLTSDGLRSAILQKHDVMGLPLAGLHAVWPLEEVTLLALPDAIHPPWAEDVAEVILPPAAPVLSFDLATSTLSWTKVTNATGYTVQVAGDTAFAGPTASMDVGGTAMAVPAAGGCPEVRYYRVRARRDDQDGPWSNTWRIVLDAADFSDCVPGDVVDAPVMDEPVSLGEHRFTIQWSGVSGGAVYRVEEAADTDFFGARELYVGLETSVTLIRTGEQATYYRVRAERGGLISPWSRTVWLLLADPRRVVKLQPQLLDYEAHLRIHDSALRFAAARSDLLAVFSLPLAFREQEAVTYVRSLAARVGLSEERALSYGAVYHPWVWMQEGEGTDRARLIPPDGPLTGRIAWRALERGAWVAPANDDLPGTIALAPDLTGDAWALFAENQINLVMRAARGFLTLGADTLSPDESLRLISTRRLLILLRRLALREGASMVFQPNDDSFRRLVQRRFEGLLGELYQRGAFAGATAAESFRVVTDSSVNPPQSMEAGRFVVELRVAPSKPLTFLTVRLIQAPGESPAFREV